MYIFQLLIPCGSFIEGINEKVAKREQISLSSVERLVQYVLQQGHKNRSKNAAERDEPSSYQQKNSVSKRRYSFLTHLPTLQQKRSLDWSVTK